MAAVYKTLSKRHKRSHDADDAGMGSDSDDSFSSISTTSEEESPQKESLHTNVTSTSDAPLPTRYKSRVLMLTSRGVSHRHRHLLADLQ